MAEGNPLEAQTALGRQQTAVVRLRTAIIDRLTTKDKTYVLAPHLLHLIHQTHGDGSGFIF
jgi:hypothetical protein